MKKTKKKAHSTVGEMVRDLVDDKDFVADFEKHSAETRIAKKLFVLRNSLGMSQKDIADIMGCSQSRISKLESGKDEDFRLGDLFAYFRALEMDTTVVVHRQDRTAVDQVKFHAACIKRLCEYLAKLAVEDAAIAEGVSKFFGEAAFNLIAMLHDSAKQLPLSAVNGRLRLQTITDEGDAELEGIQPIESNGARKRSAIH